MLNFILFIYALIPVLLFISLGIFLKYIEFLPDTGWQAIEKLIYYILFPALLIHSIANIDYNITSFLPMAAALNIATLIMFLLSFFAWNSKEINGPSFTSILQNNIRFNSFIALTIAAQYSNGHFLPLVAIGIGTLVPTVNILSVWSLIIWGKASANESPVSSLFTNPLLIGCAIGFTLNFLQITLPEVVLTSFHMLGKTAMPLALIAVGTGLDIEHMKNTTSTRASWALFRNTIFPCVAIISCFLFGIKDLNIILAVIIITASPTATNSYILARQMGGNAPLMAGLISTSTLIAAVSMPLIIYIILNSGILNAIY